MQNYEHKIKYEVEYLLNMGKIQEITKFKKLIDTTKI